MHPECPGACPAPASDTGTDPFPCHSRGPTRPSHAPRPDSFPPTRTPRKITDTPEEKYRNLSYLFNYYLHQDWTIDGETLSDVFERNEALHELSRGIRQEAEILLKEGHDNQHLDDIFFGRWGAGYEPEADDYQTWHEVLREIIRFSERHIRHT
ncbi:contact-dependent growth inhibition system immunity protein [Nocardiopsis codii]|uniref:contact-dependent growth inhibition system immunity protein n=1 Tax=Nocardiopsis codii TaxID=3065942 RepID=UPI0038B39EFC